MLEVHNIHAGYGRVAVLRNVSLAVAAREIVLVLGRNGVGKSTLLRTIAGFLKPSRGTVLYYGSDVTGLAPDRLARMGLRLVLEGHRVFPDLSVRDNLRLGGAMSAPARVRELTEEVFEIFPILKTKFRSPARDLSGGQQQMLALAQAFITDPKVLLCDEPSLGLAQALVPSILTSLRRWAERGAAILIVEQQIDVALSFADRAIVIEGGEVVLAGAAEPLKREGRVQEIYLSGRSERDRASL